MKIFIILFAFITALHAKQRPVASEEQKLLLKTWSEKLGHKEKKELNFNRPIEERQDQSIKVLALRDTVIVDALHSAVCRISQGTMFDIASQPLRQGFNWFLTYAPDLALSTNCGFSWIFINAQDWNLVTSLDSVILYPSYPSYPS